MRDKNRIYDIVNRLEAIWNRYPDLRLGQLILNVVTDPALYYVEDEELIEKIEKYYLVDNRSSYYVVDSTASNNK